MIFSIKDIAFKFLKSNKFIVVSSIVSIMLSVALIINLFVLTSNAQISLKQEMQKLYGDMDISVGFNSDSQKIITKQMAEKIISLPYVNDASKVLIGQLNLDYGNGNGFKIYSVGVENDSLSKSRYHYNKDISENEVALNKGLAEGLQKSEGEQINVGGRNQKIIETLDNLKQDSAMPDMLIINRSTFQSILNNGKDATYIMLKLSDKSKNLETANELHKIDKDLRVDIAEEEEFMKNNLSSLKTFLIILSALILLMSSLFILSNFQIFLYNYRHQFALIRALGGSSHQAFKLVFIQCTFINILGIFLAFAASYLSSKYLISIFNHLFSLNASAIEFPYLTAIIIACLSFAVIQLFMLIPALKSSKILPLQIMQSNEVIESKNKYSKRLGVIVLALAVFVFSSGVARNDANSVLLGLVSSMLLVAGVYILFMFYLKQILGLFLPVFRIFGGNASFVAIKNLIPQVRNNAVIIIAISTMIIIAVLGGNMFKTIRANDELFLRQQYPSDIVVTDRNKFNSNLDSSFKSELDKLQGAKNTSILSMDYSVYIKTNQGLEYLRYSLADLEPMIEDGMIPKIAGDISNTMVLNKAFAQKHNLHVGDSIEIKRNMDDGKSITEIDENTGFERVTIGAIVDRIPAAETEQAIIDWRNEKYKNQWTIFRKALITTEDQNATMKDLKLLRQKYPSIKWGTLAQSLAESEQILYQRWAFFIIVLGIIFCGLFLGIFNALMNNLLTKRKEYAILRTLELDKKGLIKVILTQAMVFIFIGVILGCILGMSITIILSFMEHGYLNFHVEYQLISIIISFLVLLSILIFTPLAINLANKKISEEIKI